jgi:ribosomal protein L10
MDQAIILTFPGSPKDRANIFADDLRKELKRVNSSLSVEKHREDDAAQDFGATLAVIITSAAVTALAKGIANFIAKHGTKIKIKIGEIVVEATGIESKDAAAILSALEKYQSTGK